MSQTFITTNITSRLNEIYVLSHKWNKNDWRIHKRERENGWTQWNSENGIGKLKYSYSTIGKVPYSGDPASEYAEDISV